MSNDPQSTSSAPDDRPSQPDQDAPPAAPDSAAPEPTSDVAASEPTADTEPGSSAGQKGSKSRPKAAPIKIGSRRQKDRSTPATSRPQMPGVDKPIQVPVKRSTPTPKPSVRDPLSPDLEAELEAALGNVALDKMLEGTDTGPAEAPAPAVDTRCQCRVMRIDGDNVFLAMGGRFEGVASLRQFPEPPAVGQQLEVLVTGFSPEDGLYELNVPGASIDVSDWSDLSEGALVEARVTGSNTGGLECKVNNVRGFIPASQIALYRVENLNEFVDQKLVCLVSEVNAENKKLVLSRRAVLEREAEDHRRQLLEELQVGQVCEGLVRGIRDFGAFVDLGGGVDGLIHISQLSWDRVEHPSEVLTEGQKVQVKVEKVDKQSGKIGLSYRALTEDPWTHVSEKFPVGSIVPGQVSRLAKFGAFVKLDAGIEGLVHISELAHHRVHQVGNVVKEGQSVEVKVLAVDEPNQRIALSLKAAMPEAPQEAAGDASEPDEPPRPLAVPKRDSPLKGGTDRPSGGDQFGLNW